MKVRLKDINDENLGNAFKHLDHQVLSGDLQYKINKINDFVVKVIEEQGPKFKAIVEEFGKRDEAGKLIPVPRGQGAPVQLIEGKEAEYDKKFEEFVNQEIELDCPLLNLDELKRLQLTPAEGRSLNPFITTLQVVKK